MTFTEVRDALNFYTVCIANLDDLIAQNHVSKIKFQEIKEEYDQKKSTCERLLAEWEAAERASTSYKKRRAHRIARNA